MADMSSPERILDLVDETLVVPPNRAGTNMEIEDNLMTCSRDVWTAELEESLRVLSDSPPATYFRITPQSTRWSGCDCGSDHPDHNRLIPDCRALVEFFPLLQQASESVLDGMQVTANIKVETTLAEAGAGNTKISVTFSDVDASRPENSDVHDLGGKTIKATIPFGTHSYVSAENESSIRGVYICPDGYMVTPDLGLGLVATVRGYHGNSETAAASGAVVTEVEE